MFSVSNMVQTITNKFRNKISKEFTFFLSLNVFVESIAFKQILSRIKKCFCSSQ